MIDNPGGLSVTFVLSYKLLLYSRNPQRYRAMPVDGGITIFVAALVPFLVKFVERSNFSARHEAFLSGEQNSYNSRYTRFDNLQTTAHAHHITHFRTLHKE